MVSDSATARQHTKAIQDQTRAINEQTHAIKDQTQTFKRLHVTLVAVYDILRSSPYFAGKE